MKEEEARLKAEREEEELEEEQLAPGTEMSRVKR